MRQQRLHGKASQATLSKRRLSQVDISLEEIPIFNRRSYTMSSSGTSASDNTVYNKPERAFDQEIRRPPSISLIHSGSDSGYPMSRESSFNNSGFSSSSSTFAPLEQDAEQRSPNTPEITVPEVTKKVPQMSWFLTLFLLIVVTGVLIAIFHQNLIHVDEKSKAVAVTVDWLVEAMDEISTTIRKEWVGLILLPAISSVAGN